MARAVVDLPEVRPATLMAAFREKVEDDLEKDLFRKLVSYLKLFVSGVHSENAQQVPPRPTDQLSLKPLKTLSYERE